MTVSELLKIFDEKYPKTDSCPWDNDGLMVSADPDGEISKVLVSLDPTIEAIDYAAKDGYNVLLTHHPLIFGSIKSLFPSDYQNKRLIRALTAGISVVSFHTRLDVGINGVNETLARALGFEPVDKIYAEEDNFFGIVIDLGERIEANVFAGLCRDKLDAPMVRVTGSGKIQRVLCVGGAGKDFAMHIPGVDALLTGECSYNAAQNAAEDGMIVLEAGHFETEFPVCTSIKRFVESLGIEAAIFNSLTQKII